MNKNILSAIAMTFFLVAGALAQDSPFNEFRRWQQDGQNVARLYLQSESSQKMSKLERKWQEADEGDREDIAGEVEDVLASLFEKDLEQRADELEKIVQRIDRLRAQLEKRRDMKEEIIGLQLKQITMGWDGLGWSEPGKRGNAMPYAFSPSRIAVATGQARSDDLLDVARLTGEAHATSMDSTDVHEVVDQMIDTIEDEGGPTEGKMKVLASKLSEIADDQDPVMVNDAIWGAYQKLKDEDVNNEKFWYVLGKAAAAAAARVDEDDEVTRGNVLDTAAHCFDLAGDQSKALKLQREAVRLSKSARGGTPDSELSAFLEELEGSSNEDEDDSEDGLGFK